MKTSWVKIFAKKITPLLVASAFLVACGRNNSIPAHGGGMGGMGGIGGLGGMDPMGNMTIQTIMNQVACQSSAGPQAFTVVGFQNLNGQTSPFQPNLGLGIGTTNTYVGGTAYGDVVVVRQQGNVSELIIKLCHRAYIPQYQVTSLSAHQLIVNASRYCAVNEITSGTINIMLGMGGSLQLLPRPLHTLPQASMLCQGNLAGF
jgi:hypothetical protein